MQEVRQIETVNKLGLGSVQFGMVYGATNRVGQPSLDEVTGILAAAQSAGIRVIDTAPAYGESEAALGKCLPADGEWNIITKTPAFRRPEITPADVSHLVETFHRSLQFLRRDSVYGLLAHHADDWTTPGGEALVDAITDLKEKKLVRKIGVSVYTAEQIDAVLDRFSIDLIQLPLNVLDQRLIHSGHLQKLADRGIEIHARSVFLQGILLSPPEQVNGYFQPVLPLLRDYHAYCQTMGWSAIQGAIAFVAGLPQIAHLILGVCSRQELAELLREATTLVWRQDADFSHLACTDERMVNPSLWQLR
jgi:aryl-alcohol dehydrogenase-like predicted oxidoreductase